MFVLKKSKVGNDGWTLKNNSSFHPTFIKRYEYIYVAMPSRCYCNAQCKTMLFYSYTET